MDKIPIMIVDDHKLIRDTWSLLLGLEDKYEIVAKVGTGEVAVELAKQKRPTVVLLDINMAPLSGFDILKQLKKFLPAVKVIGVSMHTQPAYARKMLRAGAKGYVTKNSGSEELLLAVSEVLQGRTYICEEVRALIVDQSLDSEANDSGISSLSDRELEIIGYIRDGLSSKEIAEKLFLSYKTVEVHRHNILQKLNVKNAASLIQLINFHGL
jgi:two-component system invasion response regulator UvrY